MDNVQHLQTGAVTYELTSAGDEVIIRSAKVPGLLVLIPMRAMEAFGLRKLRENALQPQGSFAAPDPLTQRSNS